MSRALELLQSLSESSTSFDGRKGEEIKYLDNGGNLKSGTLSDDIVTDDATAKISGNTTLYYDEIDEWWMTRDNNNLSKEEMNEFTGLVHKKNSKSVLRSIK